MKQLEQDWYQSSLTWRTTLLLPFSFLFRSIVSTRKFLYRNHLKKSFQFDVPVIVVGNITVGGTGKTPFVIWLANALRAQGFNPGIVSRGVGGVMQKTPRWVNANSNVKEVGDEALLLLKRSSCPIVIGIDRAACVKELLSKTNCNVVISDDGLQHYRLKRKIEIAIVDGMRELGNRQLLPAGPLREPSSRLKTVNFIVKNGGNPTDEFGMTFKTDAFRQVNSDTIKIIKPTKVHAVAGIGHPPRFFNELKKMNFELIEHVFPDHYLYQKEDLNFGDDLPIIMTEKDAVKCKTLANKQLPEIPDKNASHFFRDDDTLFDRMFYLPVEAVLGENLLNNIVISMTNEG